MSILIQEDFGGKKDKIDLGQAFKNRNSLRIFHYIGKRFCQVDINNDNREKLSQY